MLVTSREQKLINALVKKRELSIAEMLDLTGTSRRTLYRDLKNIQQTLPQEIVLHKSNTNYQLSGDLSHLTTREIVDYTLTERLCGELLLLIDGKEKAYLARFEEIFGISQPTITHDLRIIENMLQNNGAELRRDRGLQIIASEETLRSLMVAAMLEVTTVSEVLTQDLRENKILSLLDISIFEQVRTAFAKINAVEITDKTQVLMAFFLLASLLELSEKKTVKSDDTRHPSKKAIEFVGELAREFSVFDFSIAEITYLASIYDILYFGFGRQVLFLEKFDADFSYKIRRLIDEVSTALTIPFSKDDRLYGLLYTHLKGTDILPELFSESGKENPLIRQIMADNAQIYAAIGQILPQIFAKKFSNREIAFVSLHFAATLERSDLVLPLSAALVTSRGMISCEFLISYLRKNFPFLRKIEVLPISAKLTPSSYDIIFTTERELNYLYVDRSLQQDKLDEIRHILRDIQQHAGRKEAEAATESYVNINQLFTVGNQLVETFEIQKIENRPELAAVIHDISRLVKSNEPEQLSQMLKQRFDDTHLAIPGTTLALLHGIHRSIESPYFGIFDLSLPVTVTAMDRSEIQINRALVLLSPPDVDTNVAYLLGKISSSIIENKLYTTIYNSGNAAVVKELLRQIITESIRKYEN